jgi:hypothetical protein
MDNDLLERTIDKQELLEKSLLEIRDLAYNFKLNLNTLELENRYLKQSIEEMKKILEKEAERRERDSQASKSSASTIRAALITGILGFVTATVVAVISLFKH